MGSVETGKLFYAPFLFSFSFFLRQFYYPIGRRKIGAVERGTDYTKHRQSLGSSEAQIGKKSRVKPEDGGEPGYSSSDDSDDSRMDIEFIGYLDEREKIEDEDGDQYMDGDDDKPWGAGAPLRVPRSQHVELKSSVNTDSSLKTDKGVKKKGKKKVDFETSVKIKNEPAEEDEVSALPALPSAPSSPSSPKVKLESEGLSRQFKEEFELEEQDRLATLREMVGDISDLKIDEDDIEMVSLPFISIPAAMIYIAKCADLCCSEVRYQKPQETRKHRDRQPDFLLSIPRNPSATRIFYKYRNQNRSQDRAGWRRHQGSSTSTSKCPGFFKTTKALRKGSTSTTGVISTVRNSRETACSQVRTDHYPLGFRQWGRWPH